VQADAAAHSVVHALSVADASRARRSLALARRSLRRLPSPPLRALFRAAGAALGGIPPDRIRVPTACRVEREIGARLMLALTDRGATELIRLRRLLDSLAQGLDAGARERFLTRGTWSLAVARVERVLSIREGGPA
jgi:hypothetical protein